MFLESFNTICTKRPFIKNVINQGGRGFAKRWSYLISLFNKSDDQGEGGVKEFEKLMTSIINGPRTWPTRKQLLRALASIWFQRKGGGAGGIIWGFMWKYNWYMRSYAHYISFKSTYNKLYVLCLKG